MKINRSIYHDMVAEAGYQNQLAVDIFKSNRTPDLSVIENNKRLLHRIPNYMKEKKKDDVYLHKGLKTSGVSPVELTIEQANKIFTESTLIAKAPEQFLDLFPQNYSPTQKLTTLQAKKEYDRLFNYAVDQSRSISADKNGLVLKVMTEKGATVEISNLNRNLDLKQIKTLNLKNVENKNRNQPQKLVALAQINGSEKYERLGTISEISRKELNLEIGGQTKNATAKLTLPITENQVRLSFKKASQFAVEFYESIPVEQRHQYASAAWHLCHCSRDNKKEKQKTGNFVYAAFTEETIEQLKQFQVKQLTITGLQKPTNQLPQETWNQGQTLNFSVCELDLPTTDDRYGKKILFVEGIEMGVVSDRYMDLPNGSTFNGKIEANNIATANLKIWGLGTPIKFGKVNRFDYSSHHFKGETVDVSIEYHQPPPIPVLKLNNKIIGELDSDSVNLLKEKKLLVKNKSFSATLDTYGSKDNYTLHTLASFDDGVCLRLNNQGSYSFKNEQFDGASVDLSIDFTESKKELAVKIDDKIAGVFTRNQKSSLSALTRFSGQNNLDGLKIRADITSNLTIAEVKIDPDTVKLGEIKAELSKEQNDRRSRTFGEPYRAEKSSPKTATDSVLFRMKQLPTLPWTYIENEEQKYGLCVDYKVKDKTANWLRNQGVKFIQINHLDPVFEEESKRGYSAFVLNFSSISPQVEGLINRSCGQWLNANTIEDINKKSDYHQRLEQVPELNERRKELFNEAMSSSEKQKSEKNTNSLIQQVKPTDKNPLAYVKPLNSKVAHHMKKDIAMAEVATQFIGKSAASVDIPSSTRNYQQAWGDKANTGSYNDRDIVMVSGSGPWRGVTNQQIQTTFDRHYQPLLRLAIENKATIVVGNAEGTDKLVAKYLKQNNYQLELTKQNYILCKPMVRKLEEEKSDRVVVTDANCATDSIPYSSKSLPIKREAWEKGILNLALNSLTPTSNQVKKGVFEKKYMATHDLKTDSISIEDVFDKRGIIYQVQKGKEPTIDRLSKAEKSMFASLSKRQFKQIER